MYANIRYFLFGRTDYGTLLWCSHHSSVVKVAGPFGPCCVTRFSGRNL